MKQYLLPLTAVFFTATSNPMTLCNNADFEQPRVPAEAGAELWTPPAEAGWLFSGTSGLINTTAPGWSGPHAEDGTQAALLHGADARVAQSLNGLAPGTVYHLRWSETALNTTQAVTASVALVGCNGSAPQDFTLRTLAHQNSWLRKELVFTAREPSYTLTFAAPPDATNASVLIDRVRLWAEPPAPPANFPRFIVPGCDSYMDALRSLFFLHYTSCRILATFSMHWIAEAALWPALDDWNGFSHRAWSRQEIITRDISPEGYVSCHQHIGLGHPQGWPFPLWLQGPGAGWHFATHGIPWFAPVNVSDATVATNGVSSLAYSPDNGWHLRIDSSYATIEFPAFASPVIVASYFIIDWLATATPSGAQCFLEWRSHAYPEFSPERRVPVELTDDLPRNIQQWLPLCGHPAWRTNDVLTGVRLVFENAVGTDIHFYYLASAVDTRHNYNGALYIDACHSYATWCGDVPFLHSELPRMRHAMQFMLNEFRVAEHGCVYTPWLGHDGSSGIYYDEHGNKHIRHGYGIGNNYWDLLPFGGRDPFATLYLYGALNKLAELEDAAAAHPDWHIAPPPPELAPARLRALAQLLATANTQFWNHATGRFAPVDLSGVMHDYGFTFLNCEAAYYGYASPAQAESIMQWLEGSRSVDGDTSTGSDIYHWEFGPRATTRRNIDYYNYPWCNPESIPFGGQVQDGGAVLGFTYHDLMLRLRTRGPDNAWQRLREILNWFIRVQAEGGYREYYYGSTVETRGTLQGGGTAGGLGLDCEFFESILVPQIMLYGFMGVQPRMDGLAIAPRLPSSWPSLTITDIRFHDTTLDVTATTNSIRADIKAGNAAFHLFLPSGTWRVTYVLPDGTASAPLTVTIDQTQPSVPMRRDNSRAIVITPESASSRLTP